MLFLSLVLFVSAPNVWPFVFVGGAVLTSGKYYRNYCECLVGDPLCGPVYGLLEERTGRSRGEVGQ